MAPPSVAVLPSKRHPVIVEGPNASVSSSDMEPEEKEATPRGYGYHDKIPLLSVSKLTLG